jgi:hypothetical protein
MVGNNNIPEDIGKMEIDEYLDSSRIIGSSMNEVSERKGSTPQTQTSS